MEPGLNTEGHDRAVAEQERVEARRMAEQERDRNMRLGGVLAAALVEPCRSHASRDDACSAPAESDLGAVGDVPLSADDGPSTSDGRSEMYRHADKNPPFIRIMFLVGRGMRSVRRFFVRDEAGPPRQERRRAFTCTMNSHEASSWCEVGGQDSCIGGDGSSRVF